jgi:uncharacterized lipoprotein YmbA
MRFGTLTLGMVLLAASACSVLEPKPDASRYFLLRPTSQPGSGPALDDLVLGVGPVNVPDYLDRIEMLEHIGPYEVRYSAQNRWVEPLGVQLARTLAENLDILLEPRAIVRYPWYRTEGVGLQAEVTFDPIRREESGTWSGTAEWLVRDPEGRDVLERGRFAYELGRDSSTAEDIASRFSEEVRRMSGDIAAAVRRHYGGRP